MRPTTMQRVGRGVKITSRRRRVLFALAVGLVTAQCGAERGVTRESGQQVLDTPTSTSSEVMSLTPRPSTTAVGATTDAPPSPAAPTPTTGTQPTGPPLPRTLSIMATGDVLLHSQLWKQAEANAAQSGAQGYDYRPMFDLVRPLISRADLSICHMEIPIAPAGENFTTYPLFGVQPQIVEALAGAGYDRCSTASNHTLDRGVAGVDRTIDVLTENGLGWSGSARTPEEIEPSTFEVAGVVVSHLSYTFSYNGLQTPAGQSWRSALIDSDRIVADARRARELGAEVVLVSMHWGTEDRHHPDDFQRRVADQITAPGVIDVVIGHHAHVLQPIEQINGTWVLFGAGNAVSAMPTTRSWSAATQDGAVFQMDLRIEADHHVEVGRPVVYPTWVDRENGYLVVPVVPALNNGYPGASAEELRGSLGRTSEVLGDFFAADGAYTDGVVEVGSFVGDVATEAASDIGGTPYRSDLSS